MQSRTHQGALPPPTSGFRVIRGQPRHLDALMRRIATTTPMLRTPVDELAVRLHEQYPADVRAAMADGHMQLVRAVLEMPPKHVLVCAPSNAAIDEIVARLLRHSGAGMLNARGESFVPLLYGQVRHRPDGL